MIKQCAPTKQEEVNQGAKHGIQKTTNPKQERQTESPRECRKAVPQREQKETETEREPLLNKSGLDSKSKLKPCSV